MSFLLHNAPHLIGFGCQLPHHRVDWPDWQLDMSGIGTGGNAVDHHGQEPRETAAYRPTDAAQGQALTQ
jgi:hypothetical protein